VECKSAFWRDSIRDLGAGRDAGRLGAFPANLINVFMVAALSLVASGPVAQTIVILADPDVTRNCHQIKSSSRTLELPWYTME
jgi:predicted dinucleotide-utilizing enzyme